jgi:23S rRNA pseudouridine1911/1915/1917 synthase
MLGGRAPNPALRPAMTTPVAPETTEFQVSPEVAGLRLDQCLARCVAGLSRRTARIALDLGAVFVDRKRVKVASRIMRAGQSVRVNIGSAFFNATQITGGEARTQDEAKLPQPEILFEDEHLLVVIKPAGLLSAPTPESDRNNLLSLLSRRSHPPQPLYIVHRLDLHTSGILALARTELANRVLSETFRQHTLVRRYDVWVEGHVAPGLHTTQTPVGGKSATTHFETLRHHATPNGALFTQLCATLETGRTHQIRIHASSIGHAVLADQRYGQRAPWHPARIALHACHLSLPHPSSNELMSFDAALPSDLASWLTETAVETSTSIRETNPS